MTIRAASIAVVLLAACNSDRANAPVRAIDVAPMAASGGDTPVTSTLADAGMQIRSDGHGAYLNSSTLSSVIQGIGDWLLDSYYPRNSTRTIYVDFSQPIAGSGPNGGAPVPIPSGLYKVHFISKCSLFGNNLLTLAPGATIACPMHVGALTYSGNTYSVQMNPYTNSSGAVYAPETNYANVSCVRPTSGAGPCTGWTFAPSGTGGSNVGKLQLMTTVKGQTVPVNQGDFKFAFSIGVTNP